MVDPSRRGIWRKRGHIPDEAYYNKVAHPIQVIVWGAIGPNGFRTNLIRCPKSVTAEAYCRLLLGVNFVFHQCASALGHYAWQQDGASPHRVVADLIMDIVPEMVDWPSKSPDLSPIEKIWSYLKARLRGNTFNSADELSFENGG